MNADTNYVVFGRCDIHSTATLRSGAVLGKPFRKLLTGSEGSSGGTTVGEESYIGCYSIVGSDSRIGSRTIVDDHCIVESSVEIGTSNLLIYRAQICNEVQIGNDCVIGGFVCENATIGNGCRIFGKIVHAHRDPSLGWDDDSSMEESPRISDLAFVGFEAVVAGDIAIGRRAYICSQAVITKDVPEYHVAAGTNRIVHFSKWKGRLADSNFFRESTA